MARVPIDTYILVLNKTQVSPSWPLGPLVVTGFLESVIDSFAIYILFFMYFLRRKMKLFVKISFVMTSL